MASQREQTEAEGMLHKTRIEIDAMIQIVGELKNREDMKPAEREIALSYTHLQEAKMWLGQSLGMFGSELPKEFADKAE